MIKTQNLVPEVYYNRSRDFQLLGRIYDIIFNYLKTNIDTINNAPYSEDLDDKLVTLVSTTLGFRQTHEYNIKQLKALCSTFTLILRNKGNLNSVQYLLNLLANVEGSTEAYYWTIDPNKPYLLNVFIPLSISDTSLFEDMLTYVLPAGMSYRIVKEILIETDELEDIMYFANDKGLVRVEHGSTTIPSGIPQIGDYPNGIQNSSDAGSGRFEDTSVVGLTDEED